MALRKTLSIGSVSHGTLRAIDLLGSLAYELESMCKANKRLHGLELPAKRRLACMAYSMANKIERLDHEPEEASDMVNSLQDHLNDFCQPYTYFGTNEDDGSDIGCWPRIKGLMEAVRTGEVLQIHAGNEVPSDYSGFVVSVNDHGNCALIEVSGTGKHRKEALIWDCV